MIEPVTNGTGAEPRRTAPLGPPSTRGGVVLNTLGIYCQSQSRMKGTGWSRGSPLRKQAGHVRSGWWETGAIAWLQTDVVPALELGISELGSQSKGGVGNCRQPWGVIFLPP